MGKINILKSADKDSIINFLRCEIRVVDVTWMRISMLVNMIALIVSVWLAKNKIIFSSICIVLCGIIAVSYLFFERKMIQNKKNLYFFHGIYTGGWSLSLGILAYSLLEHGHKKNFYWIFIILIVGTIFTACITAKMYVKKIEINYYKSYKAQNSVITIPAMCVFLIAIRPLYNVVGRIYILAGAFVIIGIFSVANMVYFLLKAYGYTLIDEKEVASYKIKANVTKPSFNKFGKK